MNTRALVYCGLVLVAATCGDDRGEQADHGDGDGDYVPPHAQRDPPVAGYAAPPATVAVERMPAFQPPPAVWPEPRAVELAAGATRDPRTPLRIDDLGAGLGPVTVELVNRATTVAAGIDGIVVRVSRAGGLAAAGPARLTLDYRAFRWAYGGDWAARLALWALPECALTSPDAAGCRGQQLAAVNDAGAGTVSAVVDVGKLASGLAPGAPAPGMLVMLAAAATGAGGDYSATSLAPAATWSAGGNAGDFSWTYPLRMPPSLGGPAPSIELAYSSASTDGRMASTNNQASWVGEGFDWQPGAIERRYNGCADDMAAGANNTVKTGDQCWVTDNASLSLGGHAGELLKDAANPNLWHLRNDDGTRIEHRTGGPNGDNDGEWWIVTTLDGVQSWFGGRAGSNATLTAPVFGNHGGEPCHQAAFKDSSCTQAYRWMLDRVVDPSGNTMALTYAKETNKYGKNNSPDDDTVYDRDAYPVKIEYGTRTDSTGSAPIQVVIGVADRCLSGCTTKDAAHWPDVPWDRECTAATCGPSQTSPTFWSTKRLASITTQVWTGSAYKDVEQWTLTHSFPMSDQPTLWLDRVSHRGLVGGTASVPDLTFSGVALVNRVDTNTDQYPAMMRYRMKSINSETGGKLDITYSAPDCIKGTRVPDQNALHTNVLRCYPVKWTPEGLTNPINDFFHKYLVTDVTNSDLSGSSSRVVTHYDYLGDPAWHYTDDDGFIKPDFKTWSVWRGYAAVRTIQGDPGEQTSEERRYFRGMHGDKLPSGTRAVTLAAIAIGNVPAVTDEDAYAGQQREVIKLDGPGGGEVTGQATEPYQSAPTATRTINGVTVTARHVDTAVVHSRTTLDGGRGPRTTATTTTFDALGVPIQVDDSGDQAVSGDERCTMMEYARNPTANLLERRSRERGFAVSCAQVAAGGLTDDDVIGETRTAYDDQAWNAAPTRGLETRVETMLAYHGGAPSFVADHVYSHDSYGRTLGSTDLRGNTVTTTYAPATGGPVTATSETNALGWTKSVTVEPAWGLPLTTLDANGRKIELAYDPLGRMVSVWLAGRDRATASPNITYDYLVRNDAPTVITSRRLNASGGYITTYKLFDNMMRDRQAQVPDEAGGPGAVITDMYYDSAGRQVKVHDRYLAVSASLAPVPPSTNLFLPTQNIPRLAVHQFDGAGRETAAITKVDGPPASAGGTELWRTTTAYGGDRTDVTPPAGATPTSTVADVRGNTIELRQYQPGHAAGSASGFDRTTYAYDRKGKLAGFTDPAGNTWSYRYDLRNHKIRDVDPDKGTTTTVYNAVDDVATTTDGRGVTLAYTYDALGRKLTMRDGSATGGKRAEWFYDRLGNGSPATGVLVKTIRYDGTDQYIKEYLGFTADYEPTSASFTIPNTTLAAGVQGSYSYVHTYNPDGSTATTRQPALGDLGLETLSYGYNALGKPTSLGTSLGATLIAAPDANTAATEYTSLGELAVLHLRHNAGPHADIVRTYDTGTRRLAQLWTTRASGPTTVADVRYSYDAAGNVTRVSDLPANDHQCFTTDYLRRLTTAWTPSSDDCSAAPAAGSLGGPAAYWHGYSYDAIGNRTELVEHVTPAGPRDTTYTVPGGGHRLTATSTVDSTGTHSHAFTYDASGNTRTRTVASGTQTLTWNAEGLVATSQDTAGTTSYLYDVDGSRLIRKDPTGTTLYLPGQELRFTTADGSKHGTRYYGHAGDVIAMRTASGVTWLSGDHHETAQLSINAVDQTVAIRRETPFGELRSTTGIWPAGMDKGFVGGTNDNTGLTHLGAREYDPVIGRFISVDPVIDSNDPQQLHGYAYANNSPVTAFDPDGKLWKQIGSFSKAVVTAPGKAAHWVNDHAGEISAVTGILAVGAALMPPPIDAAAPFLEATSLITGALATKNDCSAGKKVSCGLDVVGMIPGARFVTKLGRSAGAASAFAKSSALFDEVRLAKGGWFGEFAGLSASKVRSVTPALAAFRDSAYADMMSNPFLPEHPEKLKDWAWWGFGGLIELSHVAHISVEQNKEHVEHEREREDEARVHNYEAGRHESTKPTRGLYSPVPEPPLPHGRGMSRGGSL